jgi:hypothetical protein
MMASSEKVQKQMHPLIINLGLEFVSVHTINIFPLLYLVYLFLIILQLKIIWLQNSYSRLYVSSDVIEPRFELH